MATLHAIWAEHAAVQQPIHCPDCGRYLTAHMRPVGIPPLTIWTRLNCRGCKRWDWFDAVTGQRKCHDLTELDS